jgi:hypothetical protein
MLMSLPTTAADGVSEELSRAAHKSVYLPMHGFMESLNVAVASALVHTSPSRPPSLACFYIFDLTRRFIGIATPFRLVSGRQGRPASRSERGIGRAMDITPPGAPTRPGLY